MLRILILSMIALAVSSTTLLSQSDTSSQDPASRTRLVPATMEFGLGMGLTTITTSYTWDGNEVPGSPIEKWYMPQVAIGGRVPFLALSPENSLQAAINMTITMLWDDQGVSGFYAEFPLHVIFRQGYGSTRNTTSMFGFGVGAGASFLYMPGLGIANIIPAAYAEIGLRALPFFLRTSVNLMAVDFTANDSFYTWSVGIAIPTKGLPSKNRGW